MDTPTLPLNHAAIARILPHRYPFLLVDRVTVFEPDTRIVGVKNVTATEPYLSPPDDRGRQVLPPTILTEAIAQVGGILILAKPENAGRLVYFRGIERVRFKDAAKPGDSVEIEVRVVRLRSRMGVLTGFARVGTRLLVRGTMTFALGPKADGSEGGEAE